MRKKNNNLTAAPAVKAPALMDSKSTIAKVMNFSLDIPLPTQTIKGNGTGNENFVLYGQNNLYPNYLLKLYNDSSMHKAIIDNKVNYLLGDGVVGKNGVKLPFKLNPKDDTEDLMRKIIKDYLIFNYYALEVVYDMGGSIAEINHISSSCVRTNIDRSKFWYSPDWADKRIKLITYEPYVDTEDVRGDSRLYFYAGYTPSAQTTYPTPEYSGAIKSIEIDIAIKDFHLNNISNGFSGSSVITFFRGEPTPEVKDEIVDSITNSYSGTKGDKIIFQFLEKDEQAPEISQLSPTEWNEAYLSLREATTEDIIVAHKVTSPMLFGIKTEGQLGGATELETAYSIFKQLWVKVNRREILSSLNDLISSNFGLIEVLDSGKLFAVELSDSLREKVYTIDEIRAMEGKEPLSDGSGNRLLSAPVVVKEEAVQSAEKMGLSKEDKLIPEYREFTAEEEETFNSIGTSKEEVVVLESHYLDTRVDKVLNSKFSDDKLTDWLLRNKLTGKSFKDIQEAIKAELGLSIPIIQIKQEYTRLVSLRLIPNTKLVSDNDIKVARNQYGEESESTELRPVEIRYSYSGPADDRNRAFCHRLVRANKFYSREDIQKIADLFGYDVFSYKGGYNCRHSWQIHSVVRKG